MNISIYGLGNFGYAITKHLSNKYFNDESIKLSLYDRNKTVRDYIRDNKHHPIHHKYIRIRKDIQVAESPEELLKNCDLLILAITSKAIPEVLSENKKFLSDGIIILNTAKALAKGGETYSQIISDTLHGINYHYAILAGGTIASDLFQHQPLGATLASKNNEIAETLQAILTSDNLYIETSSDVLGVELASSFKNIISILAGIVSGLNFSYGSETHLISKAAEEIQKLCHELGDISDQTFSIGSQCWGNDMWMSCTGKTRNREFGELIGKGVSTETALATMKEQNKTVEGYYTCQTLKKLLKNKELDFPILQALEKFINQAGSTKEKFSTLLKDMKKSSSRKHSKLPNDKKYKLKAQQS